MPVLAAENAKANPIAADVYEVVEFPDSAMLTIFGQTEEDFFRRAPESRFCEYIDGVVYMPSPVRWRHQKVTQFLLRLLEDYREERGAGEIYTGPAVLRLRPGRCVEPDLWVMRHDAPAPTDPLMIEGPVALLAEVLSDSTRSHDLELKAGVYREAKIDEIWFIDEARRIVYVERAESAYARESSAEGVLESTAIPGFWIDVAWLWDDARPSKTACLAMILAGPPGAKP